MIPLFLSLTALGTGDVDMTLTPLAQDVHKGCIAELELVLTADSATPVAGVDVVLSWDPLEFELLDAVPSADPWLVTGFLNDPDDINVDLTDGDALYTALALPLSPLSVSTGTVVATFTFLVLDSGDVTMLPSLGTFGETHVVGTGAGELITGVIAGPSAITSTEVFALEISRLGTPPNPDVFKPGLTSRPVLGAVWDPYIDHTSFLTDACLDIFVMGITPINLFVAEYGTALCILPFAEFFSLPGEPFSIFIPPDCSLIGIVVCTQGVSLNCVDTITLTNALDLLLGNV